MSFLWFFKQPECLLLLKGPLEVFAYGPEFLNQLLFATNYLYVYISGFQSLFDIPPLQTQTLSVPPQQKSQRR